MTTVVVMGVSGSGKTTIARLLAPRIGAAFVDADDFHAPDALAQMSAGEPLSDAQRAPWLDRVREAVAAHATMDVVLACSALTPAIRERLTAALPSVRYVWLHGDPALIARRLDARRAAGVHPVGPSLLPSQIALLDPPPDAIAVDVAAPPDAIVDRIVGALVSEDTVPRGIDRAPRE